MISNIFMNIGHRGDSELKSILFIPHFPLDEYTKTRSEYMAFALSHSYKVYYLRWPLLRGNFINRLWGLFSSLFTRPTITEMGSFIVVDVPYFRVGHSYNIGVLGNKILHRYVTYPFFQRLNPDCIINASFCSFDVSKLGIPFIWDHVDVNPGFLLDGDIPYFLRRFINNQFQSASLVYAASDPIKNKIASWFTMFKIQKPKDFIRVVPNGYATDSMIDGNQSRQQVVVYSGRHGHWSNLKFFLKVAQVTYEQRPDIKFVIAGPIEEQDDLTLLESYNLNNVDSLGPLPYHQLQTLLRQSSIGVLCSEPNDWNNGRSPLKILEYASCGLYSISSKLSAVLKLGLDGVTVEELDESKWAKHICDKIDMPYEPTRNDLEILQDYSWEKIVSKISKDIEMISKE